MDDLRFDRITRSVATSRNRRDVLKGLLGIGGGVVAGGVLLGQGTEAARRGFSGPVFPTWTPCVRDGNGVCCDSGVIASGQCCTNGYVASGVVVNENGDVSVQPFCCDPTDPGAPWLGHCCPMSPSGEVIGVCAG